jgi:hypothetical protein
VKSHRSCKAGTARFCVIIACTNKSSRQPNDLMSIYRESIRFCHCIPIVRASWRELWAPAAECRSCDLARVLFPISQSNRYSTPPPTTPPLLAAAKRPSDGPFRSTQPSTVRGSRWPNGRAFCLP